LKDASKKDFVGGRFVNIPDSNFPSGSFRIFSKNVAHEIVSNRKKCCHWIPEDVAIGRLFARKKKIFGKLESCDLATIEHLNEISDFELEKTVHFRCKAGPHGGREDIPIMIALHERYKILND